MTKDQVKAVLQRVPTWPEDRQQQLAQVALEIEAELGSDNYAATPEELAAIDEGLAGVAASNEDVKRQLSPGMRVRRSSCAGLRQASHSG
ncbi:MAG TPA: hypothetical protein VK690_00970 [Stellaceae bacterium]|jgi:hypothetical protein|nr:hypothetical protein [Stellaceae bacterium]